MKFVWFFLHIVAVSTFIQPVEAASNDPSTIEGKANKSSVVRIVQTGAADLKTASNESIDHSRSLPAIVPEAKANVSKQLTSYHSRSDSYATNPESDPPRYVRRLSDVGIPAFNDFTWLDIGLEHRTRFEHRHNDIRRIEGGNDDPVFFRHRAWIGIRDILDPFRFAVEFQDSRIANNKHPSTDQERNEFDLLNAYGELYFKTALGVDDRGNDRPIRFRVGRMAYETTDRRFIARNEWRNTTNTFEGFRLNLGREANDWELDLFGMQPVRRLQTKFDVANDHLWFFGAIGHWRKWSDIITIQPYYMGQKQTANPDGFTATNRLDREIHMPGIRAYGKVANLFDYDFSYNHQLGFSGPNRQDAQGYTIEVGRNIDHAWKPRISLFYGYASGDKNPNDNVDNRFDRFFGFARPWSADHYVVYENLKAPKIRFDLQPMQKIGFELTYGGYWLASSSDRMFDFLNGNISNTVKDPGFNRDRTGQSGDFIGHSLEGRIRFQPTPRINAILGYTHFTAGDFVKNRIAASPSCANGNINICVDHRSGDTDFLYFEVLISLL
ncbi:alginate export family protein [Nitrosomonas supralitoralis]|uniref:Alginate export family protein n=1 Tax=Nitrosomonas supralitoralis TaxID=2116706 RepID=A0A2P7NXE1_9PROT|nr:alginate export family protein [Nitrosomonas supralitoralis]PSJ18133.1 alginate export family protein [Nitrosomonas supralitoralis]